VSAWAGLRRQDLGGEHLSDLTGKTTGGHDVTPGSAGYDGGGATAFPAQQSGKVQKFAYVTLTLIADSCMCMWRSG
jgi:hypothetical protein